MNKSYKLSFCQIKILKPNLAEVIVDEGVIVNEIMVDEYHDFLLSNLQKPMLLFINKKNSYSYTYGALKTIAHIDNIKGMAILVKTSAALLSTETLLEVNKDRKINLKIFHENDEALNWLNIQENICI
ncbi:DUF7793 family protein [Neotamlana laminarinivorans]|uniref:DUF7793 domain-containing protein n=1 Tax=Neotamlana laminarinivorans TaxID=2883124 RepID=A0A9X1L2I6_9FLAO|nr:hypothetical protein [Tamlana laminarinivorans]MCB4799890.1 hypothetical protein [Tamlana laminarinivorans]